MAIKLAYLYRFIVFLKLIMVERSHLAVAQANWSHTNQVVVEERPFTQREFAQESKWQKNPRLKKELFHKVLYPKLRDMHRLCDGQCFYAPYECINTGGLKEGPLQPKNEHVYKCPVIASVATHSTDEGGRKLLCDYFGETDNLRQSFCDTSYVQQKYFKDTGRLDKFYTITLHRKILETTGQNNVFDFYEPATSPNAPSNHKQESKKMEATSCPKKWNDHVGKRCKEREFIGISFLKAGSPDEYLHENDTWYICTAKESAASRVTTWSQISDESINITIDRNADNTLNMQAGTFVPKQIIGTRPHRMSGMGVVFSKVFFNEDLLSFGCQFVIQESNMTMEKPPANTAFFADESHRPIKIKLAVGYVERDDTTDKILKPFSTLNYYLVFKGSESPNGIAPTDIIDFEQIKVTTRPRSLTVEQDVKKEEENINKINEILQLCDNPKINQPKKYIACYTPNDQPNCIHTGKCSAMFIVELPKNKESKRFETIKAHVYSNLPDHKTLRKVIRPKGFVAVGFSFDDRMDRDFVIVCHADGMDKISPHVSLNYGNTNIYPGNISYNHLIYNTEGIGSAEKNRILCSWEMKTAFHVNMFQYEPLYRDVIAPGLSEKLDFDFKDFNYTILLVAGNRNYPGGIINIHDFAQSLNEKFSKRLFFDKAGKARITNDHVVMLALITLLFILSAYGGPDGD